MLLVGWIRYVISGSTTSKLIFVYLAMVLQIIRSNLSYYPEQLAARKKYTPKI